MNKIPHIFTAFIILAILSLGFFLDISNNKSSPAFSPTPTFDMTQPFQLITPQTQQTAPNQQQAAQSNQQQQQPPSPTSFSEIAGPLPATVSATIETSKGAISLNLFADKAPKTVANFLTKAQNGFYNKLPFHRVEDWVVQGGDPNGNGTGGGEMPAEQTPSISFVVGSVGVARGSDPSINNGSQFFITKTQADWLNGQYTNFGIVVRGMDVVNKLQVGDKILSISTNLNQTEGGLQGFP